MHHLHISIRKWINKFSDIRYARELVNVEAVSPYHFLNSSYNRPTAFSLLSSVVSESTIADLLAANRTSSLFGTIIAPRRRWSYMLLMSNLCNVRENLNYALNDNSPGQWQQSAESDDFPLQLLQSLMVQHSHLVFPQEANT